MKALEKIAYQMRKIAKMFPLFEGDLEQKDENKIAKRLERHCVTLSRGLRIIFTLEDLEGEKHWHLSLSRKNTMPSDLECKICCKAFFGVEVPEDILRKSRIGEYPNVRHFWVKANL